MRRMKTQHPLQLLAHRAKQNPAAFYNALIATFPKTYAKFVREAEQHARKTKKPYVVIFQPYYLRRRWLSSEQLRGDEQRKKRYPYWIDILFAIGSREEVFQPKYSCPVGCVVDVQSVIVYKTKATERPRKVSRAPPPEVVVPLPGAFTARGKRRPQARETREWWQRLPDRSGAYDYVVLIRAPDDPERAPRPKGRGRVATQDVAPHLTIRRTPASTWASKIAAHMNDGTPRTFNRIAMELTGKTADVVATTTFHDAIWLLVEQGVLEYTPDAPVLFRKRKGTTRR